MENAVSFVIVKVAIGLSINFTPEEGIQSHEDSNTNVLFTLPAVHFQVREMTNARGEGVSAYPKIYNLLKYLRDEQDYRNGGQQRIWQAALRA